MILVDTSVWIDHLRRKNARLAAMLDRSEVWTHPFVIGELACGNLKNRSAILALLGNLPRLTIAADDEVLYYIEQNSLMGRGIGYIDTHLLAAVAITGTTRLWSLDRRLSSVAGTLGLNH